jgi:anti-sigma regulatory factor (Ser/Thr protein kinase)
VSAGDHLEVPLAQGCGAPRGARDHVGAFLDAHGIDGEVRRDALVVVSELVTNAVVHAGEPIALEVAVRDKTLRIDVCDGDDRTAVVAPRREDRAVMTGRGLAIVESLAHRWGVRSHRGGKSVWAEMDVASPEHAHRD